MTATLYILTLVLPLATILIVFGARYSAAGQLAKARLASDDAYRQLAERGVAAQSRIAASMEAMQAGLLEVGSRTAAIEAILKAVE